MSIVYAQESWTEIGHELSELGKSHFSEVDGGVESSRPYQLDSGLMLAVDQAGMLKIISARSEGKLVGYIIWTVQPDIESAGLIIAMMGPWFALPGYFGVANTLFDMSLKLLESCGVKYAYPHHRLNGRGNKLGKYFQRKGAVEIQRTFSLKIGNSDA